MYQLNKFSLGKARSRAPIIKGMRKFPRTVGIDGTRKKKIMITPKREELVVGLRLHQRALRLDEVNAHKNGEESADHEKKRDRYHVQQRDALVIQREQPGLPAVIGVQIVARRLHARFKSGRAHFFPSSCCFPFALSSE